MIHRCRCILSLRASFRLDKGTDRRDHSQDSHLSVLHIVVEQMLVVGLLGGIGCEEAGAIGIPAPDSGSVRTEQLLQLGIQAEGICGKIEQCISFLGQLLGQLRDFTRDLAVVRVVEFGNAAIRRGAGCGQAETQAFSHLADSRRVAAENTDPSLPIPSSHAVLEIQCQVVFGAHGEA